MKRVLVFFFAVLFFASALVMMSRGAHAQQPATEAGALDGGVTATDAAASTAPAAAGDKEKGDGGAEGFDLKRFELEGYVNAGIGMTSRPRALPRDRLTYGLRSSRAGLIVRGNPYPDFSYVVHFGVDPEALAVVTGVDIVDKQGDGTVRAASTQTRELTVIPVEEVSITYSPLEWLQIKGGHFYMPFSPAAAVIITSQMFPTRPGSTQLFMVGADQGLMASGSFVDDRIQVSLGAFNGSSLELKVPQTTPIGPAYTLYFDVHPLGKLERVEGDPKRGPFRFALGGGTIFRTGVLFDSTGYESTRFREIRLDGALRLAFRGLFVQGEVLRRLQTDDLSGRPASATGAYAQASYFQPLTDTFALAPIARYGYAREDELFAPRNVTEIEVGIAVYPQAQLEEPDKLRFILQYDGEIREPESEIAHGAVLHAQLRW